MPAPLTASGPAGKRLGVTAGNHQAAASNRGKAHAPTSLCATTWTPGGFGSSDLRVGVREGGRAVQLHRHTGISPQKRGACLHSSLRGGGGRCTEDGKNGWGFHAPRAWHTIPWPGSVTEKPGTLPLNILLFTGVGQGAPRSLYLSKPPHVVGKRSSLRPRPASAPRQPGLDHPQGSD